MTRKIIISNRGRIGRKWSACIGVHERRREADNQEPRKMHELRRGRRQDQNTSERKREKRRPTLRP